MLILFEYFSQTKLEISTINGEKNARSMRMRTRNFKFSEITSENVILSLSHVFLNRKN